MFNVELYWNKLAEKTGDPRKFNDLERQLQDLVIQSCNILIFVLSTSGVPPNAPNNEV